MNKIAILLGVSEYSSASNLPACENDTLLMKDLIESTNEFSETLCITQNEPSSKVKQRIVSFLKRFEEEGIDQLFFYYTGHGDFDGSEFYYLLGDYEKTKQKQTTIENSELDNWIRTVKPKLTVKVVDACHAGVQYIKDTKVFENYLNANPKSLSSCYFMFSSQRDEFSYQDDKLSFFTKCFIESAVDFSGTEMRYKDIIDYISDKFQTVPNQTPYFVTQATNTEVFARLDAKIQTHLSSALSKYLNTASGIPPLKGSEVNTLSLVELIKKDAERFCSETEVLDRIKIIDSCMSGAVDDQELQELYHFSTETINDIHAEVPQSVSIGKWLNDNENDYFAEPTYKTETYEEEVNVPKKPKNFKSSTFSIWFEKYNLLGEQEYETKLVSKTRKVIDGYKPTFNNGASAFRITAKPKHENLAWYDCHVAYVLSKTEIRFFYLTSRLKELNWQERRRVINQQWKMQVCELKNKNLIEDMCTSIVQAFASDILNPILEKYQSNSVENNNQQEEKN